MKMNLVLAIVFRLLFLQSVFSEVSVVDHTTRQLAMNDTDSLECLTDATGTVERYSCCLCECSSPSLSLYISHLRLVHGKDSSFSVTCGIDGCRDHFRTFSGFNSHVYRHHRSAVGVDATTEEEPDLTSPVPASFSLTAASDDYMETGADESVRDLQLHTPGTTDTTVKETTAVSAAKFLLHLREGRLISQVAVADVIAGCKSLCKKSVEKLRYGVKEKLLQAGIDPETIDGLDDVLFEDPDPFHEVNTNYQFEKFCADHFNYLVCTLYMHAYTICVYFYIQ